MWPVGVIKENGERRRIFWSKRPCLGLSISERSGPISMKFCIGLSFQMVADKLSTKFHCCTLIRVRVMTCAILVLMLTVNIRVVSKYGSSIALSLFFNLAR